MKKEERHQRLMKRLKKERHRHLRELKMMEEGKDIKRFDLPELDETTMQYN